MLSGKGAGTRPSGIDLLGAIPHVNDAVRLHEGSRGGLLAEVPIKRPRWLVPPLSWILPFSERRRVRLDVLGARILDMCDGKSTMERIVERFAAANRLSFREAQLAVMSFMRLLTERGLVAVVGPEQ
jgi:hypothetical protein